MSIDDDYADDEDDDADDDEDDKKTMMMEMMMPMRVSNLKLATEEGVLLHVHFVPGQGAIKSTFGDAISWERVGQLDEARTDHGHD